MSLMWETFRKIKQKCSSKAKQAVVVAINLFFPGIGEIVGLFLSSNNLAGTDWEEKLKKAADANNIEVRRLEQFVAVLAHLLLDHEDRLIRLESLMEAQRSSGESEQSKSLLEDLLEEYRRPFAAPTASHAASQSSDVQKPEDSPFTTGCGCLALLTLVGLCLWFSLFMKKDVPSQRLDNTSREAIQQSPSTKKFSEQKKPKTGSKEDQKRKQDQAEGQREWEKSLAKIKEKQKLEKDLASIKEKELAKIKEKEEQEKELASIKEKELAKIKEKEEQEKELARLLELEKLEQEEAPKRQQEAKLKKEESERRLRLSAINTLMMAGKYDIALKRAKELLKLYPDSQEAIATQALMKRILEELEAQ